MVGLQIMLAIVCASTRVSFQLVGGRHLELHSLGRVEQAGPVLESVMPILSSLSPVVLARLEETIQYRARLLLYQLCRSIGFM